MADLEVRVLRAGKEVERVMRPLRSIAGQPAITYHKQLWPLKDGCIELDGAPIGEQGQCRAPPPAPTLSREVPPRTKTATAISNPSPVVPDRQDFPLLEPADARVLVDAGPGTGKTHTACLRVAAMVGEGIPASRVWMISFTRTAVVEIRNRIASALPDPADAAAVKIATLDSHAWALQSGFSSEAVLSGQHEESIEKTLTLVLTSPDIADYLEQLQHLVIDEAQDITGLRAELVLAMI